MRLLLRHAVPVFGLIAIAMLLGHGSIAEEAKISSKIDETIAQRLAAEAVYRGDKNLGSFEYDDGVSNNFTPPFFVYRGADKPPVEGSFGFFAVNPWTGDVRALWGCRRLSTPVLRKSQALIRRRFTPAEMQQYAKLHHLKPTCTVED